MEYNYDSLMNLFSELFVVESLGLAGELAVDISLVAVEMLWDNLIVESDLDFSEIFDGVFRLDQHSSGYACANDIPSFQRISGES